MSEPTSNHHGEMTRQAVENHENFAMPSASITHLIQRSLIIKNIRQFFDNHGVLEVETPILSEFGVTDLALSTFCTEFTPPFGEKKTLYLATSAEYPMKRLLAFGSGPIFQISKVFRNEEHGKFHNPEFTMLEWYRPHFSMFRLIDEVEDLIKYILDCGDLKRLSYQYIFQKILNLDPLSAPKTTLVEHCRKHGFNADEHNDSRDTLLQFLFTRCIEPQIGHETPYCIYHFPASQAALAKISTEDHRISERFEIYYQGIELANGFEELTDAKELHRRFSADNINREKQHLPIMPLDERFLSAMEHGMPMTSGVALGLDRLIMLALNQSQLKEVISFDITRS